jgi:hypothetical protein
MTNEEKANEICKRHIFDSNHFDCCMEMADWKDKKHKQEKQQWIDKACEWLFKNTRFTTNDIRDFKNAMKEE